ncbi:MAG: methyltransferase domain-containing protein [Chloroflexota bacterium]
MASNQVNDPARPDFWEERYRQLDIPWDLSGPAPQFVALAEGAHAPLPGRMIVLGCGRGNDAIFFAGKGFDVTAVDFAPTALQAAEQAAEAAGVKIDFLQADMFALPQAYHHAFDYVLEHTCFAAIPPERREEYVGVVHSLLKSDGLYIAILFAHGRQGGPPFTTDPTEARDLFSPRFSIEQLEITPNSVKQREGKELFGLMRPR